MVKVKGKISGQFKSLQNEFAIIRSVIDTAIKRWILEHALKLQDALGRNSLAIRNFQGVVPSGELADVEAQVILAGQ